jgi:hypothetical protein
MWQQNARTHSTSNVQVNYFVLLVASTALVQKGKGFKRIPKIAKSDN